MVVLRQTGALFGQAPARHGDLGAAARCQHAAGLERDPDRRLSSLHRDGSVVLARLEPGRDHPQGLDMDREGTGQLLLEAQHYGHGESEGERPVAQRIVEGGER